MVRLSLLSCGSPMRKLNRPRPSPFAAEQPLPLGGVGNLDQHRGHAGLSTSVGGRSRNMKFPNGRHSFTSQHPNGELLSKDLARHASEPAMLHDSTHPLTASSAGIPLATLDSAGVMTPASSDREIKFN